MCGTTSGCMNWRPERLTLDERRWCGSLLPRGQLPTGFLQHHPPNRHDQPRLLRDRNERVGVQQPALGVLPARQGLEAFDRPVRQADDRLIVHPELAPRDGAAQVVLQCELLDGPCMHPRVEDRMPAVPGRLGAIHRGIGIT